MRGWLRVSWIRSVPILAIGLAWTWSAAAEPGRHLIYAHGRIVQIEQQRRPRHPEFGFYELDPILDAFRQRGFTVTSDLRPRDQSLGDAADRVVAQVRTLLRAGVPARRIAIVGASMGGYVTLLAATRLREPELRVAVLGVCLSERVQALQKEEGQLPSGRILAIRERSDALTESCAAWVPARAPQGLRDAREQVLDTGLRHGFLYRPLPEWVEPVVAWTR